MNADFLFSGGSLASLLETNMRAAVAYLDNWNEDDLLVTPVDDIAATLVDRFGVECPELLTDELSQLPVIRESREFGSGFQQTDIRRTVSVRPFVLPFTGDPRVFRLAPGTRSSNTPWAALDTTARTLTVFRDDAPGNTPDPDQILVDVRRQISGIGTWLDWSRQAIEEHNRSLAIPAPVEIRKTSILAERKVQDAIGIPLHRRADADRFKVPKVQRRVTLSLPRTDTGRFEPEPALDQSDYEAVLEVLSSLRVGLERSPSLVAKHGEEEIRNFLVISLNGIYRGTAAGEMFNGNGKTDILVRERDRNVFIGECKIWSGQKAFSAAIDQLAGYLSWRDVKAALLLFVREGNMTEITEKCIAAIQCHEMFKRTVNLGGPGERSEFILRSASDAHQEIKFAFLPFMLPR